MPLARLLSDPALRGFVLVERGRARGLVLRRLQAEADRLGLAGRPDGAGAVVEGGRAPHPLVELADGTRAVVRRYRRG
ncbi:MAG TPA: hypothetical protein VFL93_09980, partial [Longimicrobiaceae bacterium]|nr:hypothetical protein [Longimicrobiaceae bacterium]